MVCPGENTVSAYVDGELPPVELTELESHIDSCPTCRQHVASLARLMVSRSLVTQDAETVRVPSRTLGPGTRVGRLVVLGFLGRGGMGQVVEAYDPELERHVALKVIDPVRTPRETDSLQREAIAMARLAHPNVVTVFDVATWGDQLCVAMELVTGATLDQWVRTGKPPRRDILEACLAAGRGLAAAHAAGIVHRDFKPANVLRGTDGRVRVGDFGLAALGAETAESSTIAGTPGYMSPEQMAGAALDARSDQFSFCVVAWKLLGGTKPFAGTDLDELREACRGKPAGGAALRPAVRRVLSRGLAHAPADRYPDMPALLAALRRAARRPQRIALAAAALVVIAGGVAYAALSGGKSDACTGAEQHLAGIWDAGRRGAVQAAFVSAGAPNAFAPFAALLDTRTEHWVTTRTEACRATERAEQSPQLLDARMQCLDEQLGQLRALVDVVQNRGNAQLSRALEAAHGLPAATACSGAAVAGRGRPTQFAEPLASRAAELDRLLEGARTRIVLLDLPGAKDQLARADQLLAGIPDPVREARAAFQHGRYFIATHEPDKATEALERAGLLAARAGDRRLLEVVCTNMIRLLENNTHRAAEGRAWETTLELQLAAGGADDDVRGDLEESHATIAFNRRDYRTARDHAARAVELQEHAFGKDAPDEITALQMLARATTELDGRAAAEPIFQHALRIAETAYGPDHPLVATTLADMAIPEPGAQRGALEQARKTFERALAIRERAYGPDHPLVAETVSNIGDIALSLGDLPLAQRCFERELAIAEKRGDETSLADPLMHLGSLYRRQGKTAEARAAMLRSLAVAEHAYGKDYPGLLGPLLNLGDLELAAGGCKVAAPYYERLYRLKAASRGGGDMMPMSYVLLQLATCDLDAGNFPRALERAQEADRLRAAAKVIPVLQAESQFTVAQALERTGHRSEALALAETAAKTANPSFAAEMQPWLAAVRAGKRPAIVK